MLPPFVDEQGVLRPRLAVAARARAARHGGVLAERGAGQQLPLRLDGRVADAVQLVDGGLERFHDRRDALLAAAEHEHVDGNLLDRLEGDPVPPQLVEPAAEGRAGRTTANPHPPVVGLHAEQADVERAAAHVRRPQPRAEGVEQGQRADDVAGGHQVRDEGGGLRAAAAKVVEHARHRQIEFGGQSVEKDALDGRPGAEVPQLVAHADPPDRRVGAAEHPHHVLRHVLCDGPERRGGSVLVGRQVTAHGRGDVEVYLDVLRLRGRDRRTGRRLVPRGSRAGRQGRQIFDAARVAGARARVGTGRAAARGGHDGQTGRRQDGTDGP